jgi:hypothetical protein
MASIIPDPSDVPALARRSSVLDMRMLVRIAALTLLLVLCAGFGAFALRYPADLFFVVGPLGAAAYLVPGVVLLLRRNWHVVGWLLCLFAVGMAWGFSVDWTRAAPGPWIAYLADLYQGSLFWLPMVALLALFPDGYHGLASRHARLARVVVGVTVCATLVEALSVEIVAEGGPVLANPTGLGIVPREIRELVIVATILALLAAFAGLVFRYRSSGDVSRHQYRWVLWALGVLMAALVVGLATNWWYGIVVAYLIVPMAFMVAILRYRLYEIDRLVSRSVTYAVVVGVVAVVYVVVVGVLSRVVPGEGDLAVAGSTLAVAAVFSPVRRRVQGWVDRRFNRSRFDAGREVEAFSGRLGREVDLGVVESDLLGVVERTLQPSAAGLWIREGT